MLPGCSSTFSDCSQAAARQLPSCCTEVSDTCRKPLGEAGSRHGAWGRRRHGASARYRHGASGRRGLRPSCLGDALGRHRGSTVRRRATHAAMRCATRLPGRSATLFAGQPPINFACSTINCKAVTVASASGCSFPRFPRTAWGHCGWASAVRYGFGSHCGPSQVVRALTSNHDAEHVRRRRSSIAQASGSSTRVCKQNINTSATHSTDNIQHTSDIKIAASTCTSPIPRKDRSKHSKLV